MNLVEVKKHAINTSLLRNDGAECNKKGCINIDAAWHMLCVLNNKLPILTYHGSLLPNPDADAK